MLMRRIKCVIWIAFSLPKNIHMIIISISVYHSAHLIPSYLPKQKNVLDHAVTQNYAFKMIAQSLVSNTLLISPPTLVHLSMIFNTFVAHLLVREINSTTPLTRDTIVAQNVHKESMDI
jgi:hypothetical protein